MLNFSFKISWLVYIVICWANCISLYSAYEPRSIQERQEKQVAKAYLIMPGGKILMGNNLPSMSRWIVENISEKAGKTAAQPLFVPIPKTDMDRICMCLQAIQESNLEKLQFEVLSDLELTSLANLLIYSWFLKADDLLLVAGREFIGRLKKEYTFAFAEQPDFLGALFSVNKADGVNWKEVLEQLTSWLARYVLSSEDKNMLREKLIKRIPLSGAPTHAHRGLLSEYIAMSGTNERGGSCDVLSINDEEQEHSIHSFKLQLPAVGSYFSIAPLIVMADAGALHALDLITDKIKKIPLIDQFGQDALINCMALSPNGRKVALSAGERVMLVDLEKNKVQALVPEGDGSFSAISGSFLQFVNHTPVLVDMRSGGNIQFIRIWNTETGKCLLQKDYHRAPITKYCCNKDGVLLAFSSNGVLIRLNCALNQKGELIKGGTCDNLWDPEEKKEASTLWGSNSKAVCFHSSGERLVLSRPNGTGVIIDTLGDCSHVANLQADETIFFVDGCYGKDQLLATLDDKKRVMLWDGKNGQHLAQVSLDGIEKLFWFSPDGYLLMSKGNEAVFSYYGHKKIVEFVENGLTLEQGLALLLWLQGYAITEKAHLVDIIKTIKQGVIREKLGEKPEQLVMI